MVLLFHGTELCLRVGQGRNRGHHERRGCGRGLRGDDGRGNRLSGERQVLWKLYFGGEEDQVVGGDGVPGGLSTIDHFFAASEEGFVVAGGEEKSAAGLVGK